MYSGDQLCHLLKFWAGIACAFFLVCVFIR
jgi:uncharacterized iron-regulated membrane protein